MNEAVFASKQSTSFQTQILAVGSNPTAFSVLSPFLPISEPTLA
jgi:hypothetical protein